MNLLENLSFLAADWLNAWHDSGDMRISLATLGARVHKDAKLFERLADGGSINIPRYEALVDYLSTDENWPENVVPDHARVRLARMGIVRDGERLVIERDTIERQTLAGA